MTHHLPDQLIQHTAGLLRSLQGSILRLREEAEELRERLAAGEEKPESSRIARLEGLIRDCQKVEKTLVEQTQISSGAAAGLDLDAARTEIRSRLDRLRAATAAGGDDRGAE